MSLSSLTASVGAAAVGYLGRQYYSRHPYSEERGFDTAQNLCNELDKYVSIPLTKHYFYLLHNVATPHITGNANIGHHNSNKAYNEAFQSASTELRTLLSKIHWGARIRNQLTTLSNDVINIHKIIIATHYYHQPQSVDSSRIRRTTSRPVYG